MDNFDELMGFAEVYVGPVVDELNCRLLEGDYAQDDSEVVMVMLTAALTNIVVHDNRGDPHGNLAGDSLGASKQCWTTQFCVS